MNIFQRLRDFLLGGTELRGAETSAGPSAPIATGPHEAVNDATAYGVAIQPVTVAPGAWYWQVVRVHHLTPDENGGKHHVYLDILDPTQVPGPHDPLGQRVFGAWTRITWDGGEQIVTVDKPINEPGANFPMWKWQVCSAVALGLPGEELPADSVTGMHTGHPDEAPGNTLFHHSFALTFVKTQAPAVVYKDSVIYGVIHKAARRNALLLRGDESVATTVVGTDETFRFADLEAGDYVVALAGTALRSAVTPVNGQNQVRLELTLVLAESAIAGRVRNGAGRTVVLTRDGTEVARQAVAADEAYRFTGLTAGVYQVALAGTQVVSGNLTVDGASAEAADLVAPAEGKPVEHYVLFGPAEQPATEASLLLARPYLLAFGPTFGFNPAEASQAGMVTIVADAAAVSAEAEAQLRVGGALVQRISGNAQAVAAALGERVARGQPF